MSEEAESSSSTGIGDDTTMNIMHEIALNSPNNLLDNIADKSHDECSNADDVNMEAAADSAALAKVAAKSKGAGDIEMDADNKENEEIISNTAAAAAIENFNDSENSKKVNADLMKLVEQNDMTIDDKENLFVPNSSSTLTTITKMSLISATKEKKEDSEYKLSDELLKLVSGLYLNVTKRLCLQIPFRCATELSYCHNNHYRKDKPLAPNYSQVSDLHVSWQQARYVEFLNIAGDMCARAEFPGEGVFTKLVELILTTSYERNEGNSSRQAYAKIVRLFRSIVNAFPPCWLAMRSHYIKFFRTGLDITKLVLKTKTIITTSNHLVNIIFDLIDYTFANYNELISNSEDQQQQLNNEFNSSQESATLDSSAIKSQCFSQWNWDDLCNDNSKAFCNLKTDSRLERINVILGLLLPILERDLCMWMLHHHTNPKKFIFDNESSPLVVLVFEMSAAQRSTRLVRKLFEIFAKGVSMRLNQTHLKLVERWIALIMVASHTADIEETVIGIRYPTLEPKTRELIKDFFRYFKYDNKNSLDSYFVCIDLLRVPYVKFEFIDHFLRMFNHKSSLDMLTPHKIANILALKNYLRYKKKSEMTENEKSQLISCEQYYELLIKALRAYCEMYGLEQLFKSIKYRESVPVLQTATESVHRFGNGGTADNIFKLDDMKKDKLTWLSQLRMGVRMSRPKVNLPPTKVIDNDRAVISGYRNDLKHCMVLTQLLIRYARTQGIDECHVIEWLTFCRKYEL